MPNHPIRLKTNLFKTNLVMTYISDVTLKGLKEYKEKLGCSELEAASWLIAAGVCHFNLMEEDNI